jgi:hypothetical protein
MADKEKILAALAQLDPLDDDQWTADGAPKVEVVTSLAGETVKRQDIVNAAPDFNREKAGSPPDDEQSQDPGQSDAGDSQDGAQETGNDPEQSDDSGDNQDPDTEQDEDRVDPPSREMSEPELQSWLKTVPPDQLEDIEKSLKDQHDEVGQEIKRLQDLQRRITRATSLTRQRIKEAFPNSPDQHAIRNFIESQNAARAERVARRQTILKGIRPEELDFRAPIDAAYARKTKRGTQRPVRPIVK